MRFLTTTIPLFGPLLNGRLGFLRISGRLGYRCILERSNQRLLLHALPCTISQ
uniref:Uncharacterized protein n=1 Tax=Arundo donax TaxID=35708 RepID=A0A0A9HMV6_ARUDO